MRRIAGIGLGIWIALAAFAAAGIDPLGLLELFFLLAAWVLVPLGFSFLPGWIGSPKVSFALLVASGLATASFCLPTGSAAAILVLPWLGVNGLMALGGLLSLRSVLKSGIPGLLRAAALLFPTVGGIHLVSSRLGYNLAGFPEPIILLTAIHFSFTAFAAPVLALLVAQSVEQGSPALRRLAKGGGLGLVAGIPLLAAGFVASPILKLGAVALLVLSVSAIALAQVGALEYVRHRGARVLLTLSSLAVLAGMTLAMIYEHGFFTGRAWIGIPSMARTHGVLNGVGFCLLGLWGWSLELRA